MSRITNYIEERQNEVADEESRQKALKRVTVRLSGASYAMLMEIAATLKDTNTGCAEELLDAAIQDAWHELTPRTTEDLSRVLKHGI